MVKYLRFDRNKWDKDGLFDTKYIPEDYWTVECFVEVDVPVQDPLTSYGYVRISGDYLFTGLRGSSSCYYSVMDYWEWCRLVNRKFPNNWLWMVREVRLEDVFFAQIEDKN
jgi:hypothetical protein